MSRTFPVAVHESWEWTGAEDAMLAALRDGALAALDAADPDAVRVEAVAFFGRGADPGVRLVIQRAGEEQRTSEVVFNTALRADPREGAEKIVAHVLRTPVEEHGGYMGAVTFER